jgi:DNA-binding MarR family transcriptional regulator
MWAMGYDQQPLWRQVAAQTLHASFLLKAKIEEVLQQETGLLLADHEALLNLEHARQPPRMSDIAQSLTLSAGGTTKVIDRLEALGYVARSPDPADRRATVVEITPEGREAHARTRKVVDAELEAAWAKHMTESEAKVIVEVMRRVLDEHLHD